MIIVVIFYFFFLLYYSVNFLSFSIVDVDGILHFKPLEYILNFSFFIFGKNDFALRLPQIIVAFLAFYYLYNLVKNF